jgi:predicted PurR-regulated permease PerM
VSFAIDLVAAESLGVAGASGLIVGTEREWSGHASGRGARFAGVRTFLLIGLLGGVAGWLTTLGHTELAALILAGGAAITVTAYWQAVRRRGSSLDGTTEAAALMVLALGVLAGLGHLLLAVAGTAVITPMLSVGPPLLLALTMSSEQALAVILLFWGVHTIEGFFVTPIAERRALKLPPALTIAGQVLLGVAGGVLGVALAAPLVATGLVLVRSVYIEDVLGDRGHATSA